MLLRDLAQRCPHLPQVFLRSLSRGQTYWTFEDTLTQIGLGYVSVPAGVRFPPRADRGVHRDPGRLLAGVRALSAAAGGFRLHAGGRRAGWPHLYSGFLAHFNKNSNLSWAFDVWFLNLFPREKPFLYNGGGWSTLSFIPTLATMMLGLWAGRWLMTSRTTAEKLKGLVIGGVALTLAGLILPVAAPQSDHQAHLDVVLHALQRRPRGIDARRLLCPD